MMLGKMYLNEDVLGLAMQAAVARNAVIASNIANADTPGFKKSKVLFEASLQEALDKATLKDGADLGSVSIEVGKAHESFSWRIDENNVDMEAEMSALYQNSAKYDALASCVINYNKRLNLAILGR
jgi:flagellar basal-body rod protein FlgB